MIAEVLIAAVLALAPMVAEESVPEDYTSDSQVEVVKEGEVETVRVTEYCPSCNCPPGHGSASGKYLEEGDCACGWLPMGTVVIIDGEEYTVVDVCGTDAIDIFVNDDSGECRCERNEYEEAVIIRP